MTGAAQVVMERCDLLSECSEELGQITRPFASEAMRRAHELVGLWMGDAGMSVRRDQVGNLIGRYEGEGDATLLLGSHLDSVRNAGRYDGPLGVMVAIAAVERLHRAQRRLPFAIEVLAFADEEGMRFGSTYLGSRAVAGTLEPHDLERHDANGITVADAVRWFGGRPDRISEDRWSRPKPIGYVEVHIEQGPVLDLHGLPVGVVTAIAGQNRFSISFQGEAGHAGTVPMERRRDALVVAAMFVVAVEQEARAREGLVATVGKLEVQPGAANVIPSRVDLSLDVRHADDSVRLEASRRMLSDAHGLAESRGVAVEVRPLSENAAVPCAPRLVSLLTRAVEDCGQVAIQIPSGAGHDGVAMSSLTEVGMLFVRCKEGVSHHPAESAAIEDVAVAIDVLSRLLELIAHP